MMTRPHPSTPVTNDAELTERWRALLRLEGPPSRRSLFLAWLRRDGTMVPLLIPVEDVPLAPDRAALADLLEVHTTVAESEDAEPDELHLAMLLERRGPAGLSPDDHAWCSAIEAIVRDGGGVDCSVHVGTGRTVVPVLPRRTWPARSKALDTDAHPRAVPCRFVSTQIAVRLPQELVEFIDRLVAEGRAPSRAAVVSTAIQRERRRELAARDAAILAAAEEGDELDALAEHAARTPLDDLD